MKGQYKILVEIMLFAIGLALTSYVVLRFNSIQDTLTNITADDNMNNVANVVLNGVVKSYNNVNSTIKITIPDEISRSGYIIYLKDNLLTVMSRGTGSNVTRQLFNISQSYSINTEVSSGARFIEIENRGNEIVLKRSKVL